MPLPGPGLPLPILPPYPVGTENCKWSKMASKRTFSCGFLVLFVHLACRSLMSNFGHHSGLEISWYCTLWSSANGRGAWLWPPWWAGVHVYTFKGPHPFSHKWEAILSKTWLILTSNEEFDGQNINWSKKSRLWQFLETFGVCFSPWKFHFKWGVANSDVTLPRE